MSDMKFVVTGGYGMIGGSLIKYLLDNNNEVLAIVKEKEKILSMFPNESNLNIIENDLKDIERIKGEGKKYDVFYHIAWDGVRGNDRNDAELQLQNVICTINAVKLAKRLGCNKFIATGSQAEYGQVSETISEVTKTEPDTAYGVAKLCANQMSKVIANQLGIEHIWTRILSVYGPRDNENTMIISTIREMLENNKSPEYTKAEQLWDYIYIDDIVRALYLIGKKGISNSIYCIGNGTSKPLYYYIEEIRNQINRNIELKLGTKDCSENQVMSLCVDITKLTNDTGFKPEISFEEGIRRTIEWYKESKII